MENNQYWVHRPETAMNKSQRSTMIVFVVFMILAVIGLVFFLKGAVSEDGFTSMNTANTTSKTDAVNKSLAKR